MSEKKTRRSGAGVKPPDGCANLARKQVLLDSDAEALLLSIGNGNLSLGVREAARRLAATGDIEPFQPKPKYGFLQPASVVPLTEEEIAQATEIIKDHAVCMATLQRIMRISWSRAADLIEHIIGRDALPAVALNRRK